MDRSTPGATFATLIVMPIEWKLAADYEGQRALAERRIAARDSDYGPMCAAGWAGSEPDIAKRADHRRCPSVR